jgi:purine-binding chemotaxis protein CheW
MIALSANAFPGVDIMRTEKSTAAGDKSAAKTSEQYLTFMLAGEEYGVDILRVQEIKGWDKVTRIPHTPDYVLGVINLRGAVVPIIDLRRRFGLEAIAFGPTTVVVVVRVAGGRDERTVGVVVDAVSEVYNVETEDTKPPPDVCGTVDTVFVKALATVDDKMLILLDIDRLIGNSIVDVELQGVAAA